MCLIQTDAKSVYDLYLPPISTSFMNLFALLRLVRDHFEVGNVAVADDGMASSFS